jgi:hypothetical protein
MYRQRLGGWLITAGHHLARWRIEAPMYAHMYRQQLASWIGSRAPGWGVLSFIQSVMSANRPIPVKDTLRAPSAAAPSARDDLK